MTTEVTKFDPTSYVDKIRDKIKQSLVDVIPDEQWNQMLRAEIAGFFENSTVRNAYGAEVSRPSEFRRIVQMVLEEETKRRVRDILAGPAWETYWNGTERQVGEEVGRIARENGPAIMSQWFATMIGQMIESIRFQQP